MKRVTSLIIAGLLLLCQTGFVLAANKTFTVSASVPLATGVGFTASRVPLVNGVPGTDWTTVTGTGLSFDSMVYDATNNIWGTDHFFAIDVAPTGGAGTPDVTVTYSEGNNPNSPAHGLGWKATATFMKVTGTGETALTTHGPKKMLKDLSGEHITSTQLSGGYLRTYLGIVTKDSRATYVDPALSEVFTNADKAGTYDGSVLFSATVL